LQIYQQSAPKIIEAHPDINKTNEQIVGEAAITAITLGSGLIPKKPPIILTKTLGKAAPLAYRTAVSTGLGAVIGGATAMSRGGDIEEVKKETLTGAKLGAILAPVIYIGEKVATKVAQNLYRGLVRYSETPEKATKYLMAKKVIGTIGKIQEICKKDINLFEKGVQTELKPITITTTKKEILEKATALEKRANPELERFFQPKQFEKSLQEDLEKIGLGGYEMGRGKINMVEANAFRKKIDTGLNDKAFKKALYELPKSKQRLRILRTVLSDIVKENAPNTIPIFEKYSPAVNASHALTELGWRLEKKMPITFFEIMGLAGGSIRPSLFNRILVGMVGRRLMMGGLGPSVGARTSLELANVLNRIGTNPQIQAYLFEALAEFEIPPFKGK